MHQWALTSVAVTKSCSGTMGATNRSTTDQQTTDQSKPVDSKSPCMVEISETAIQEEATKKK